MIVIGEAQKYQFLMILSEWNKVGWVEKRNPT